MTFQLEGGGKIITKIAGNSKIAGLALAFLIASFASSGGAGGSAAQAAKPRIAGLSLTADQLSAEVRAKIDAAVAGGLAASGADVVDSGTTAGRIAAKGLGGCETSTCRVAIAEVTGAGYLMRGAVESMGRSYTIHLEMIDGATGVVIGIHEDRCEICTEGEAYDTASATASTLKAEVLKRPGATTASGDQGKPGSKLLVAGVGSPSASTGVAAVSSPPLPPAGERSTPRLGALSWIGVGAGAVAVGAGIYVLHIDGRGTCDAQAPDTCPRMYGGNNRAAGFTLIGAGALVLTVSAALLIARF